MFVELCPFYDSLFFKIEIDVLEVKLRIICVHQKSIDEFTDIDYCDCDCNAAPIADNDNDQSGVT